MEIKLHSNELVCQISSYRLFTASTHLKPLRYVNEGSVIREIHRDTLTNSFGVKPDATIEILLLPLCVEGINSGFSLLTLSSLTLYPAVLVVWDVAGLLADSTTWNWGNFSAEAEGGMLQTWAGSGVLSSEGSDSGSSEKRLIPDSR